MKRLFNCAAAVVAGALLATGPVAAQDRTLKLIVPSSAGGVHDVIGRLWADGLKQSLGSVVIDNRGGGGGSIGVGEAQRATPDGNTMLLGSNSSQILQPVVYKASGKSLAYDPIDDFDVVSVFALTSTAIAVTPTLPAKSLSELIELLRANPDKYNYAHGGVGTVSNVSAELFKQLAGNLKVRPVSYRGMGPAQADIINGTLEMFLPNITGQVAELHNTGKIRVLSVNAPNAHGSLPGIPTSEAAGLPGMIAQSFFAILAPKGSPKADVDRVNAATRAAIADKTFQDRLAKAGFEPLEGLDPAQSLAYMKKEHVRWEAIVKSSGVKQP
jgi:tripartite-type tricarboxylate transporter receptor subunit TctC